MREMPISCPRRTATELMLRANALFRAIESPLNEPFAFVGAHVTSWFFFLSNTCMLKY